MTKKFNLSEKIEDLTGGNTLDFYENIDEALDVNDVKEFIKRFKEEYLKLRTRILNNKSDQDVLDLIDELAGKNLI